MDDINAELRALQLTMVRAGPPKQVAWGNPAHPSAGRSKRRKPNLACYPRFAAGFRSKNQRMA
jgi:hypothetical protein